MSTMELLCFEEDGNEEESRLTTFNVSQIVSVHRDSHSYTMVVTTNGSYVTKESYRDVAQQLHAGLRTLQVINTTTGY